MENWNDSKKAKKLREIITNSLLNAVDMGYKEGKNNLNIAYNAKDLELLKRINDNIYTFAAYKNYQTIKELGNYLKDTNGDIRSFADFRKAVLQDVHAKYNLQWLEAEYNTTYAQAQNASRWTDFESNKDLFPMLKYNTQRDANVRDGHKALQGIVAPIDDEIWDKISPVRAWQCRCYLTSHQASEVTVTKVLPDIPKLPKNSPFSGGNVGKTGVVFGEQHPYFDVSSEEKARIKSVIEREGKTLKTKGKIVNTDNWIDATKINVPEKGSLSEKLYSVEKQIHKAPNELAFIFDDKANLIGRFTQTGTELSVDIPIEVKNLIITHNHPINSFFSTFDIQFVISRQPKIFRAVLENGTIYEIVKPLEGWIRKELYENNDKDDFDVLERIIEKLRDEARQKPETYQNYKNFEMAADILKELGIITKTTTL